MEILLKYFPDLSEKQRHQFGALEDLYQEWNSKINVISRKDLDGLYEKHVLHSLSIAAAFKFDEGTSILDMGTGGGFPGIPLAIYFPEVRFHLVDSIAKKIKVVDAIVETIGLNNVTTNHTRAEEISNRKFDFVVSRAVAALKDLWKWSKPLLRTMNREHRISNIEIKDLKFSAGLICLKGGDLAEEISQSGTRPGVIEIYELFQEEYFRGKYLLYVV